LEIGSDRNEHQDDHGEQTLEGRIEPHHPFDVRALYQEGFCDLSREITRYEGRARHIDRRKLRRGREVRRSDSAPRSRLSSLPRTSATAAELRHRSSVKAALDLHLFAVLRAPQVEHARGTKRDVETNRGTRRTEETMSFSKALSSSARCLRPILCASALLFARTALANEAPDTVFLTGGGRVRGTVMVDDATEVSIKLPDGTTRRVPRHEVARVEYAGASQAPQASPPTQVPSPAPTAPAASVCKRDGDCASDSYCDASDRCVSRSSLTAPIAPVASTPGASAAGADRVRYETKGIPALYIAGPALLGLTWSVSIMVTAAVSSDKDKAQAVGYSCIPVAGPWVMLSSDLKTDKYTGPLVLSGVLQGAGLVMTVLGVSIRRRVPQVGFELGKHTTASVAPVVTPTSIGFAGKF
jgi:hypothetical protein